MKCKLCEKETQNENGICPVCAEYLYRKENDLPQEFAWDGGTLLISDVMKELDCDLHTARAVLDRYGFKTATYQGIALREFRMLQLSGELASFLGGGMALERKIGAAIRLLTENGYEVKQNTKGVKE